ncbi:MAG: hypothetical protein IPG22_05755 [Acidobacteria bacterium]|nr:hypothetical protein [Acidobacteriota bacterium]
MLAKRHTLAVIRAMNLQRLNPRYLALATDAQAAHAKLRPDGKLVQINPVSNSRRLTRCCRG